jgi:hypothetical protein
LNYPATTAKFLGLPLQTLIVAFVVLKVSPVAETLHTMLYLVGLGLSDETDITVKGLEAVKKASRVYLEAYTSILLVDQSVLVRLLPQDRLEQRERVWAPHGPATDRANRSNTMVARSQ